MRAETRWRNFSFCLLIACQTLYMESAFADDRVAPVVVTPRQQSWLEERTQRWANASEIFEKDTAAGIANGRTILDRDRQVFGTDHQRTLESLNRLADFHFRSQKLQEADDFRRETVEISTRLYGEKSWRTLDFRWKRMQIQHLAKQVKAIRDVQRRGDVAFLAMRGLQKQERFTEAIAKGREVLEAYRQVYGDNNPLRAGVLNDIASNLRRISDYEQARNSAVESLDMYRGWLTNNSPQAASVLNQLALIAFDSGNADLAERYFRQSIEAYERSYPELKPDEIDGIDGPLHNLAALYADRRETARAIEVGERALAARARFGKDSTDYALTQTVLGGLRLNNGDIDAARTLLTEAARTIHAKSPENHFQNDQVSRQLCNLHMYAGEYDEANRVIQELLELGERQGLADSLNHVWPLTSAATVQARMKNYPESELYFDRAFNICRQQVGPKHWRTHDVWNKQARELWAPLRDARDAGQLNETRPRIARLAQLAVEIFGADSVDARNFAMQLRHTDVLLGLTPEQRDEFRAVLEQANQGRELLAAERSDEALPVLLASIGRHEALLGDEPYFLYDSYFDLGRIYVKKSRYDEADAAFERAQSLIIESYAAEQLPEIYRKLLQFRADLEYKRGNLSKALTNWHQVREQYRLAGTANESGYLVATHWVGYLSKELQQFDQAEAAYRETAEIAARTEGLNSNAYARALNYIGQVYSAMGQYGRETDVYRDGLQRLEKSGQQQTELAGVIWHNLGIALRNAAKLEESAEAFDRAVAIRREFGDKWDLAVSRGEQTATLRRLERWMDALAANREAFEIDPDGRRKSRWKDDLEEIHRALIERVSAQGKYDLAVTVAAEMNENIRARFGAEHPRTQEAEAWLAEYRQTAAFDDRKLSRLAEANDATREAIQNQNKGDYDAAISQRRKALDICTELYGPESLRRAKQLEDLGLLQFLDWDISAARQSVQECLRIRERRIASKCQPVAEARLLLGHIAMGVEEYDAAEQECTAVLELLPEDTRSTARAHALIALGRMRRCQNRLIEADELLREAQQAAIATQEREAEVLVQALQSRAGLELMLGDLVAAERLASQAVDLARMRLGESAIIYGSALGTLADVKYERDENAEAERLYRDSLGIMEQRFGAESVMTARCINNLANVHLDRGDLVVAQTLYERAARTFLERQGRLSVDYALAVSNLGSVFRDRKQWPKAEENAREALTIVEEVAGQDSLDCRYRRGELLELLLLQRKVDHEASDLIRATLSYDEELVRQASRFQTERQQLTTQQSLRSTLDRYFSCGDALESPDEAYRHVLQWKGAVFTRQRQLRAAARRPESAGAFADWSRVTGQLATLSLRPPYPDEAEVWNHQIRLLTLRKDDLEYELLARAGEEERATPSVDEIRKALPERTALVDFLSYRDQLQLGSLQYVAFVVRPGEPTARVTIAKAAAINQQIDRWRVALDWDRQPDALEADREKLLELYSAASEQQTEAAAEIRTQLWHEIEPLLKGVDRVLISTDGDLAKFPWDALPGRNPESYLFEDYSLGMVPVPSLLPEVAKHASATGPAPLLTLLGNIDYGDQSRYATLAQRGQVESIELRGSLPFFFTALPGTIGETVSILGHFQKAFPKSQTVTLEGIDASEAAFRKHAVGSRWIHIATHGFFASDVMEAAVAHVPKARPGRVDESGAQPTALSAEDIGVHEGLMSGLALANANLLAGPHQDDGILSALEVATTDLDEVELAVLSACESGLGTNISGEGVLGLQRAFQVAGAASTITTLWPVDDEATRIFMDRFYDNLWVRKLPKSEALRETRQWFIDTSRKGWGRQPPIDPATLNGQSEVLPPRYASPEYWGAFVLSGDWN